MKRAPLAPVREDLELPVAPPRLPPGTSDSALRTVVMVYDDAERRRLREAALLAEHRGEIAHVLRMQAARTTAATRRVRRLAVEASDETARTALASVARELAELALRGYTSAEALSPAPGGKTDVIEVAVEDLSRACALLPPPVDVPGIGEDVQ